MGFIINLILLALIGLFSSTFCSQYKILKPEKTKKVEQILKKIKAKKDWPDEWSSFVVDRLTTEDNCYLVDINNDNKKEIVFATHEGSGGYLNLFIFTEESNNINLISDQICYKCIDGEFINPITNEKELFVQANNKIFVLGRRYYSGGRRILYWEDKNCIEIVDKYWLKQQRKLFTQLFNARRYYQAYSFLAYYEKKFRGYINSQDDLWIRSDLSLAALRASLPYTSLKIIKEIKKEKAFLNAKKSLIKAVKFNEKLATKAIEEDKLYGTKGRYNYEWLRDYTKSGSEILDDYRIESLHIAAFPDLDFNDISLAEVQLSLGVCHAVQMAENRYAYFSGFWPHNAGSKAIYWCDLKEKISIVALNLPIDKLSIISRSLFKDEIPNEFYKVLAQWCEENSITFNEINFFDRLGNKFKIDKKVLP